MADESLLIDVLPPTLQKVVRKRLFAGELLIMLLAGDRAPAAPFGHCNPGVACAEVDGQDALNGYETAVRITPNSPTECLRPGCFHSERGRDHLAELKWRMAVALAPSSPEAEDAQNLAESAG